MSVRKPYTRGGRTLYVVRPSPPVPPTLGALFLRLALQPASGVAAVLKAGPKLGAIALALAVVGLLRGIVEALWYYLMTGQANELPALLARPDWYTRYGGPLLFVVSSSPKR